MVSHKKHIQSSGLHSSSSSFIEYKVRINDLKTNMSWRLTYSEYEPKSMNWDIPEGMEASDTYITPDTNRVMAAINQTDGK
jgi:hypothetical protein